MKKIKVGDTTYKSIAEAWRALSPKGLPQITVRWRIKKGWDTILAFRAQAVPSQDRRTFKAERLSE